MKTTQSRSMALGRAARAGAYRRAQFVSQINECGIPIEQSNPEYAPGQVEVNIRYDKALQSAADRVVMFQIVDPTAWPIAHDYLRDVHAQAVLSRTLGQRLSHALQRCGRMARTSSADGGKINETAGRQFIAGLQKPGCAETAVLRIAHRQTASGAVQPYTFCPINTDLGRMTTGRLAFGLSKARTVLCAWKSGTRAPMRTRIFLLAADIAAGLDGIEQGLEPSTETDHGQRL